MKVRELRVGNKIQDDNGFIFDVVSIHDDGTVYADFEGNEGDVWEFDNNNPAYGVPLSLYLLLEFGFEELPIDNYRTYKTFKVGKRYLYFDESDGVWYLSYDENIAYCNNIGIVDYLHDLQNLYYFTSRDGKYEEREELEIKL